MKSHLLRFKYFYIFGLILIVASCATYYQKNLKYQNLVLTGQFQKADEFLANDKKTEKGKNKLLYYFNRGFVSWILNKNQESIGFFANADRIIEDQQKNYALEALSLVTNPTIKPYKPEDFEVVMVNYFNALNYIQLNQYSEAIVECRKINIKLNALNDKYPQYKNKYGRDAFAHTIMGLMYEANNNYNDAFIAYRNALEIYEKDYVTQFGVNVPEQLKYDLLRSAYKTGFYDDVRFYEEKFNMKYDNKPTTGGELVFFWQNGFGPVKSEWSINFTKVSNEGGFVTFANEEMGISFPFFIGNSSNDQKSALGAVKFIRVAFPKYIERKPYFVNAKINANNKTYNLDLAQNINNIAFKTLQDRMLREMANSLLRLATKQGLEYLARRENQNLGAAISIVNALTEKTDTRNWQTLPYSISYTRIPLPEGQNQIELMVTSSGGSVQKQTFTFNIQKGKTHFFAFQNVESLALPETDHYQSFDSNDE